MNLHGTRGAKVLGSQPLIQKASIFRWRFIDRVADVLLEGTSVLKGYEPDTVPRHLFGVSDSTVTFNEENKTPAGDGTGLSRAFSERQALWKDRTEEWVPLSALGELRNQKMARKRWHYGERLLPKYQK